MVNSVENDEVLSKSMNNGPRVSFNRDVHVKRYGQFVYKCFYYLKKYEKFMGEFMTAN